MLASPCEVAIGTTPTDPAVDCSAFLEERKLFESKITFKVTTDDPMNCPIIEFLPYYYRASSDSAFKPEWANGATTDCSKEGLPEDNINCFSGFGRDVIAGFPKKTGDWTDTLLAPTMSITTATASSKGMYSNRYTASIPPAYDVSTPWDGGGDGFAATSYRKRTFALCVDYDEEVLATLALSIADYDCDPAHDSGCSNAVDPLDPTYHQQPNDPGLNDFGDWTASWEH